MDAWGSAMVRGSRGRTCSARPRAQGCYQARWWKRHSTKREMPRMASIAIAQQRPRTHPAARGKRSEEDSGFSVPRHLAELAEAKPREVKGKSFACVVSKVLIDICGPHPLRLTGKARRTESPGQQKIPQRATRTFIMPLVLSKESDESHRPKQCAIGIAAGRETPFDPGCRPLSSFRPRSVFTDGIDECLIMHGGTQDGYVNLGGNTVRNYRGRPKVG
jgi:hypothetical protein